MTLRLGFFTAVLLMSSAGAQSIPAADHHAHLQSPTAARLLNEGAVLHADEASPEKEKPYSAKELIAALDAAGVRRATALSEAYLLASRFAHVSNEPQVIDRENDWTLRQVRRYPARLVGFGRLLPPRAASLSPAGRDLP